MASGDVKYWDTSYGKVGISKEPAPAPVVTCCILPPRFVTNLGRLCGMFHIVKASADALLLSPKELFDKNGCCCDDA